MGEFRSGRGYEVFATSGIDFEKPVDRRDVPESVHRSLEKPPRAGR